MIRSKHILKIIKISTIICRNYFKTGGELANYKGKIRIYNRKVLGYGKIVNKYETRYMRCLTVKIKSLKMKGMKDDCIYLDDMKSNSKRLMTFYQWINSRNRLRKNYHRKG